MINWTWKSYCAIRNPFPLVYRTYCQSVAVAFSDFKPVQASKNAVIILHGLLGSRVNWKSLAKTIAVKSNRAVYTLDARNHGDSPHSEDFNYHLMAEDVKVFSEKQGLNSFALIGHSMGGRTAMHLALSEPKMVEKLIVVDVSPCDMPEGSSIISTYMETMIEVLNKLPTNYSLTEARRLASNHMAKNIPELGLRMFLLTNLMVEDGKFKWKANIDVLAKCFPSSVLKFKPPAGVYYGDTLFICGGESNYVRKDDHQFIKQLFPEAKFVYIPGAGHWVHSEKPKEFMAEVEKFL